MADEDQDDSQKTEDPSQKRLDDALKKGQVPTSREVSSFMLLLSFAIIIIWFAPYMMKTTTGHLYKFIESPEDLVLDASGAKTIFIDVLIDFFTVFVAPISLLIVAIFISSFLQHGFIITFETIKPKLEKISPIKGLKRLFSMKTMVEFIKGIIKITLIGVIAFFAVYPELGNIDIISDYTITGLLLFLAKLATRFMIGVCSVMLLIAIMDFLYQKFEYTKTLRMSKRDMKDEYKQTEGNPEIKAKLREIRSQRSRQRMMQAMPTADVVITNPTHYSVALKYDPQIREAPVVIAKGKDLIALRIREVAKEHKIPLVQNPPLARALFNSVELNQEIPYEHYHAVAEVIKYVYKLKGKAA